jgi:hypothetical protein
LSKAEAEDSEACLDRLGQFLNCVLASGLIGGKLGEVSSAVVKSTAYKRSGNRLLKIFCQRSKSQ